MTESNLDLFADERGQTEKALAANGTPRGFAKAALSVMTGVYLSHAAFFPRLSAQCMRIGKSCVVFSAPCALFCAHEKLNPFLFKRFRTLCKKPPGVGWGYTPHNSPPGSILCVAL